MHGNNQYSKPIRTPVFARRYDKLGSSFVQQKCLPVHWMNLTQDDYFYSCKNCKLLIRNLNKLSEQMERGDILMCALNH